MLSRKDIGKVRRSIFLLFLNRTYCSISGNVSNITPYEHFLHSFVDINGDLSAEIIFGTKINNRLKMQAWRRISKYHFNLEIVVS